MGLETRLETPSLPFTMFLEICMQIYSVVFADKLASKKFAKTINLLCEGNKVFVKYQAQGGVLPPTPPFAYALGAGALLGIFTYICRQRPTIHW